MALALATLRSYCPESILKPWASNGDVYICNGVDPHRSEGITSQFLANASVYHERYFNPTHFASLLDRAFEHAGVRMGDGVALDVLDIGAGSGNVAIPLVTRNPSIRLVATDLSVDLLHILATLIRDKPYRDRIGFVCADANKRLFRPAAFDLVVGSSILHHLVEPTLAVENALYYLKPGGLAIFFEPFEYGCNIMKTLYQLVLDDPRCDSEASADLTRHFQAMIRDYNARFDAPNIKPHTKHLDDKWLFTKRFFAEAGLRAGCLSVDILSHCEDPSGNVFTEQLLQNVRLAGMDCTVPEWILTLGKAVDSGLDPALKRDLLIEGTVIFKK